MNDPYIEELLEKLKNTEFWEGTARKHSYGKGMNCLVELFTEHKNEGTQLFFIGNGGSSAIASHMTADFMKNGGMHTYSLYDHAVITCMGNDYGYEYIFARPLGFLAKTQDLLVAVSSSGNSSNIIHAIQVAEEKGMDIITLTGFREDNPVKQMGNFNIYVPCKKYGIVESIHNLILQQAVDMIMNRDQGRP